MQIPHNEGDLPSVAMHLVVVSEVNKGVMTTPTINNGDDDVTEILVTSQWFGIL